MSDKKLDVKSIQQDTATPRLEDKCLRLIELWIRSVQGLKWQDLIEAATKSGFGGLATVLNAELNATNGGNYRHNINFCVS